MYTYPEGSKLTEVRGGGTNLHPQDSNTKLKDNLFSMNGPMVYKMARKKVYDMFAHDLSSNNLTQNDIDLVVPHQASGMAVKAYSKYGGFDEKNNSSQLDNMMKDPTFKIPGIMTIVEKVYLKWMFDCFELSKIVGYLFSDNERMMNIHKKCGWVLIDTVPLKKVFHEEGIRWEEILDDSGLPKLNALYDSSSPVTANYPPVRRKGIQNDSNNQIAERYFNIIELTRKNLMKNKT